MVRSFPSSSLSISFDILHRLAASAFMHVLEKKRTRYGPVITWLDTRRKWVQGKDSKLIHRMRRLMQGEMAHDNDV